MGEDQEVVPKSVNDDQHGGCDVLRFPIFTIEHSPYKLHRIVDTKVQMIKVMTELAVHNVSIAKIGEFVTKCFSGQLTIPSPSCRRCDNHVCTAMLV